MNSLLRTTICLMALILDAGLIVLYGCLLVWKHCMRMIGKNDDDDDDGLAMNSRKPCILLIHGSGADENQFIVARMVLKSRFNVLTINLGKRDQTIEEYAKTVAGFIKQKNIKELTILGVSMGGLVASYYTEFLRPRYVRIEKLITIGTPFQGSPILYWLHSHGVTNLGVLNAKRYHQMVPNSAFLTQLKSKLQVTATPYLTMGSFADIQVPDEYSRPLFRASRQSSNFHKHISFLFQGHVVLVSCSLSVLGHIQ